MPPITQLRIELDREKDGRYIADIVDLPGVMAYGTTEQEAVQAAMAFAFHVIADRIEHGEPILATPSVQAHSI